jgi:hypothetical protein
MRLYAPVYEGDTLLRPDAALGESAVTVFKTPAPTVNLVRGNIQLGAANEAALDLHAIEQTARAERGSEIARLLKGAYTAVADWLERIDTQERDSFFAASETLADLENRQRHFERTGCAHY